MPEFISTQVVMAIALSLVFVMVLATVGFAWTLTNRRGIHGRDGKFRKSKDRSSDIRKLSKSEKRYYDQAKKLLAQGRIAPAATILEQLNMPREAIQAFEENGMIDEAAKILIRMQRHNRAGVVYARHGKWQSAAKSFKVANMPIEVAKCYRESGRFEDAAEYFEKAGRPDDAAQMFSKAGDPERAARILLKAGSFEEAMNRYEEMIKTGKPLKKAFSQKEYERIISYLLTFDKPTPLEEMVFESSQNKSYILKLLERGNIGKALNALLKGQGDVGPQLMAEVNDADGTAGRLAEIFAKASKFVYSGMVYERIKDFARAAINFERGGDLERAAYCFERSGQGKKARQIRKASRQAGPLDVQDHGNAAKQFALASLTAYTEEQDVSLQQEEVTAILQDRAPDSDPPKDPPLPGQSPLSKQNGEEITSPNEHRQVFNKAKFFKVLTDHQRDKIWNLGQTFRLEEGEDILTYNDEPRGVYIIISGKVACYRTQGGQETYVDEMTQGESFGELWLLADHPTTVRFQARTTVEIRAISRDEFTDLMDKDGTVARKLYKRFTQKLLDRLLKPQNNTPNQAAS